MSILDEIVEKRKKDIKDRGWAFGFSIPERQTRKIVPFIRRKGVVLEIKRASPSKGNIAPDLDSVKQAGVYVDAGCSAISVLTEENYFKGSLKDLIEVSNAVGDKCAVLRKDFLIDEEEIEIAYRCGADAVLLIARILDDEKIVSMAKKCETLGITAFIELRLEDDLRKLSLVAEKIDRKFIVSGVNARDLSNFKIDLLTPCGVLDEIRTILGEDARVIFESGIRTVEAASFAGSLGFTGMLLGEAAARNPGEAKALVSNFVNGKINANTEFWLEYSKIIRQKLLNDDKSSLIKICGCTAEDEINHIISQKNKNLVFLGFIFYKKSPRNVDFSKVENAVSDLKKNSYGSQITKVAVVVDTESEESQNAIRLVKEGKLDVLQLHGFDVPKMEKFYSDSSLRNLPHYFAVNITKEEDFEKIDFLRKHGEPRFLIDSQVKDVVGGTGKRINDDFIKKVLEKNKLWLAGGLNPENKDDIIEKYSPELIDVVSGLEEVPGKKSFCKIEKFLKY